MFVDYEFYTSEYGGKLSEEDFTIYANRASYYIDSLTLNKASKYLETTTLEASEDGVRKKIEMACSVVADVLAKSDMTQEMSGMSGASGTIYQSETVGAHSVAYRTGFEIDKALKEQINGILGVYLAGTGLLYRGIPVCIPHMI